jgi:hypothetical protein
MYIQTNIQGVSIPNITITELRCAKEGYNHGISNTDSDKQNYCM